MKKNERLYEAIEEALSDGNRLKFSELRSAINEKLSETEYDAKQLRNVLYRQVKIGLLGRDEDGGYFWLNNQSEEPEMNAENGQKCEQNNTIKKTVLNDYASKMLKICKEWDEKFRNPFDNFSDNELLGAKRAYEFNKQIMKMLKKEL